MNKNQLRGLKNRQEGKAFEALIDRSFEYFNAKGFCQIDKTPEPMRVIKSLSEGRFIACFIRKAQPDYKGFIKGGRAVVYEAKFTSQDRAQQSIVNDAQTAYMEKAEALGARCYILLGFSTGNAYCIPWAFWTEMESRFGRKHLKETDIQKFKISASWNDRLMIPI